MAPEKVKEDFEATPERKQGRWKELVEKVKKSGQAANVTGLTRGQAWGLKRTATTEGLEARVLDKGTRVIIMPPKKKEK